MKKVYLVVFLFDLQKPGNKLGKGSKRRCDAALRRAYALLRKEPNQEIFIITTAGMANSEKYPEQTNTGAQMMADYLNSKIEGGKIKPTVHSETGWSTLDELRLALDATNGFVNELEIVSSWWHLPRIWILARQLKPEWRFPLVPTWDGVCPLLWVREFFAIFHGLWRLA